MDWITPNIAIGNVDDALSTGTSPRLSISAILSLTGFPNLSVVPGSEITWRAVPLIDGWGNSDDEVILAVRTLSELAAEHCVLVHCMEGISRSPFIVAAYLSLLEGVSFQESLIRVGERRADVMVQGGLQRLWEDLSPALAERGGLRAWATTPLRSN